MLETKTFIVRIHVRKTIRRAVVAGTVEVVAEQRTQAFRGFSELRAVLIGDAGSCSVAHAHAPDIDHSKEEI